MIIKQVDKTTVDVFLGLGWEQWSRFKLTPKFPVLVKGSPMSKEDYQNVKQQLYKA